MKKQLAKIYVELKKKFDGDDFKPSINANNIDYLVKHFTAEDLKEKIEAVKSAIKAKEQRLANEVVWHRMAVQVKLPKFTKTYYFSNKDKEQLFAACTNFAHGLIIGYLAADNSNFSVSTNEVQSIDGVYWWNSRTAEKVLYIEDETGKMIKTKEDLK